LTEKEGSGSGSGSEGSQDPKNKAAKMSVDQAYVEIEKYKQIIPEKDAIIADLTHQLEEANKVLESQEKARLIGQIIPRSTYKMDDLIGKSAEELKNIRVTLEAAMPPKVNSVRFGVKSDHSDQDTVGDISWSTAQKRKGAA
jgi:hypothetical protein